jgi:hypothetical protein
MKGRQPNTGVNIILSVVVSLASIVTTFLVLILLFMSLGLFGLGDGEPGQITKMARTSTITLIISLVVALSAGFFILVKMHKSNR